MRRHRRYPHDFLVIRSQLCHESRWSDGGGGGPFEWTERSKDVAREHSRFPDVFAKNG